MKTYLTIAEIAKTYGVHRSTVTRWLMSGALRGEARAKHGRWQKYRNADEVVEVRVSAENLAKFKRPLRGNQGWSTKKDQNK